MNIVELSNSEKSSIVGGITWTGFGAAAGAFFTPWAVRLIELSIAKNKKVIGEGGMFKKMSSAYGQMVGDGGWVRMLAISGIYFLGNIGWSYVTDAIRGSDDTKDK